MKPLLLLAAAAILLAAGCRIAPAPPRAPSTTEPGVLSVHVLPNRMTLVHSQATHNQVVSLVLMARGGASADPDGKAGRARLMSRVLTKGTANRTSDEIAEALEDLGASIGAADTHDYIAVSLRCVRQDFPRVFDLFAEIVLESNFPLEEIQTERARQAAAIRMREDRPPSAALRRLREMLYHPHPYARPLDGTFESLEGLTQRDLFEARNEAFRPENMVVALVGDIPFEEARAMVEARFGGLAPGEAPRATSRRSFGQAGARADVPRRIEQGFVAIGATTCESAHADAPALDVLAALLGGGMSSRLFDELRDRRNLGYMVGAMHQGAAQPGIFAAYLGTTEETVRRSIQSHGDPTGMFDRARLDQPGGLPPSARPDVLDEMQWAAAMLWREVELLKAEPVSPEDLDRAREYLVGAHLRGRETNAQRAHQLAYWEMIGAGAAFDDRYPELIRAVTSRDVLRVANKYLADPTTVILRPEAP